MKPSKVPSTEAIKAILELKKAGTFKEAKAEAVDLIVEKERLERENARLKKNAAKKTKDPADRVAKALTTHNICPFEVAASMIADSKTDPELRASICKWLAEYVEAKRKQEQLSTEDLNINVTIKSYGNHNTAKPTTTATIIGPAEPPTLEAEVVAGHLPPPAAVAGGEGGGEAAGSAGAVEPHGDGGAAMATK